jgi:hypothetical protein
MERVGDGSVWLNLAPALVNARLCIQHTVISRVVSFGHEDYLLGTAVG